MLMVWFLKKIILLLFQIMIEYSKTLEASGASIEWIHVTEGKTDCVLMSQLTRMLIYQNRGMVQPDDIVLTIDVNAFIMTDKILDPILFNPGKKVWIMQV